MVHTCCAYGCNSRFLKGEGLGFFRFPHERLRRIQWTIAVKRKDFVPSNSTRICGKHFITGRPSRDKNNPDYVPSIFLLDEKHEKVGEKTRFNKYYKRPMKDISECPLVSTKSAEIIPCFHVLQKEIVSDPSPSCRNKPKIYTFIDTNGEIIGRFIEKCPRRTSKKRKYSLSMEVTEKIGDKNANDSKTEKKTCCFNIESNNIKSDEEILNLYSQLIALEKQKKDVERKIEEKIINFTS